MVFKRLHLNSLELLSAIADSENPTAFLCEKLDNVSAKEKDELQNALHELTECGFLRITWADKKPSHVIINSSTRTYKEHFAKYELSQSYEQIERIRIGNNNNISKSVIAGSLNVSKEKQKHSFYKKHPIICGFLISLIAGIVLLFSFWQQFILFIEELF